MTLLQFTGSREGYKFYPPSRCSKEQARKYHKGKAKINPNDFDKVIRAAERLSWHPTEEALKAVTDAMEKVMGAMLPADWELLRKILAKYPFVNALHCPASLSYGESELSGTGLFKGTFTDLAKEGRRRLN
jgi:hypothetical protein